MIKKFNIKLRKQNMTMICVFLIGVVILSCCFINRKDNLNTLHEDKLTIELQKISGFGDKTVEDICKQRPYISFEDLDKRVDNVGEVKIEKLKKNFKIK